MRDVIQIPPKVLPLFRVDLLQSHQSVTHQVAPSLSRVVNGEAEASAAQLRVGDLGSLMFWFGLLSILKY